MNNLTPFVVFKKNFFVFRNIQQALHLNKKMDEAQDMDDIDESRDDCVFIRICLFGL